MINIVKVPRINTNDDTVGVVDWLVEDGQYVEVGYSVVELETSKALITFDSEYAGYIKKLTKKGEIVRVGANLFEIADTLEEYSTTSLIKQQDHHFEPSAKTKDLSVSRFSAAALKLVQSSNLKQEDFSNSGLVTSSVVAMRLNPLAKPTKKKMVGSNQIINETHSSPLKIGPIVPREESISLSKRAEIEQLSVGESGQINSTLSIYFDSADIRERFKSMGSFDGNISPIILYEISRLLLQWPQFTAYFEDHQIHFYDRIDLGIAVDLGKGLKVVRIKDADLLSPQQIFEQTIDIGLRYIDNRIRPEELVGSTITITDLSGLDVLHFRPLINGKQSVILGIGGDSLSPGFPMSINMAFDHRVSNGREAALFLKELRSRICSYAPSLGHTLINNPRKELPSGILPPVNCDVCGIDYDRYLEDFKNNAHMMACFNSHGSLVGVCHRCYNGWT